jgi:hypothetical protein
MIDSGFNTIFHEQSNNFYIASLTETMHAANGLRLKHRIHGRLQDKHAVGLRQVDTKGTRSVFGVSKCKRKNDLKTVLLTAFMYVSKNFLPHAQKKNCGGRVVLKSTKGFSALLQRHVTSKSSKLETVLR